MDASNENTEPEGYHPSIEILHTQTFDMKGCMLSIYMNVLPPGSG